jgi:hypothetical protein
LIVNAGVHAGQCARREPDVNEPRIAIHHKIIHARFSVHGRDLDIVNVIQRRRASSSSEVARNGHEKGHNTGILCAMQA